MKTPKLFVLFLRDICFERTVNRMFFEINHKFICSDNYCTSERVDQPTRHANRYKQAIYCHR